MRIDFLGHAAFLFTDARGVRVIVDPYESGGFSGRIGYAPIVEPCDVVIITHDHFDHCHTASLPPGFEVVRHAGAPRGVPVRSVQAFHDEIGGRKFGGVIDMKVFELDGVTVCHCGDLGQILQPDQRELLGSIDVLIIPVGGLYTLGPYGAAAVTRALAPRYVVPCHYKTDRCGFDIAPPDLFTAQWPCLERPGGSVYDITRDTLPEQTTCLWLDSR